MKKNTLYTVVLCTLMAGMASASIWDTGGTSITDWNDGNWAGGVPLPTDKAQFIYGRTPVEITDAQSVTQLEFTKGTLYVRNGGSLTTTSGWAGIGSKADLTLVSIEAGGAASFSSHMWVSYANESGTPNDVTIDVAGTLSVGENIGLGTINGASAAGGTATLNVLDGGLLNLNQWSATGSIQAGSVLDINGTGQVVVGGARVDEANAYAALGRITGNGGVDGISATYNEASDTTTIVAIPEPATLGLIAAFGGGLLFVRRRFMM